MRAAEEAGRCLCGRFAAMPKVSPLDQLCPALYSGNSHLDRKTRNSRVRKSPAA